MNEEDKIAFLEDFKNANTEKKLDMWFHALEQEGLWEEIIAEISDIAQRENIGKVRVAEE